MVKICVIQGDIILQHWPESKFCFLYAYVQCMSELRSKSQIYAPDTVRGVVKTRTVLQSVTDGHTYVQIRVKLYAPPYFVAGHTKVIGNIVVHFKPI